jgi:hypothetical protein
MGVYCLDQVTPGTYLHNTMDKADIAHASNQYVEKLNIVLFNYVIYPFYETIYMR